MKTRHFYAIGIFIFFGLCLFLTFNRHSKSGYFNYHSEIWSDKAGYYVYLPAAFNYNFAAENFPDSIEDKTGNGFVLDYKKDKVITKYTYGVALMQSPFYLLSNAIAGPLGFKKDGFSPVYHWSVNIAAVFYLLLGLVFLKKFLALRFDHQSALLAVLSVFLATNLYYYAIDETGMSHVYSFALFSIFLYWSQKSTYLQQKHFWSSLFFGLLIGLIVLIRPTNILFLSAFFFLDIKNINGSFARFKNVIQLRNSLPLMIGVAVLVFPQLLYWNYSSGSFFNYSYENEGFNWLIPQFLSVWFAPDNGLFLYTPFYLIVVIASVYMIRNKQLVGAYILLLFLLISYVFSSWWSWNFGCSFGSRSYVEYLAIFSIPITYLIHKLRKMKRVTQLGFTLILLTLIFLNLTMTYAYDGCFYGETTWDWNTFLTFVKSAFIF
jgi:hypothetical protein